MDTKLKIYIINKFIGLKKTLSEKGSKAYYMDSEMGDDVEVNYFYIVNEDGEDLENIYDLNTININDIVDEVDMIYADDGSDPIFEVSFDSSITKEEFDKYCSYITFYKKD